MTPLLVLLFRHSSDLRGRHRSFVRGVDQDVWNVAARTSRNIEWRLVGLLAAGSVPSTALTLLLSYLDLEGATARRVLTMALG
jgi:hypothetical protein